LLERSPKPRLGRDHRLGLFHWLGLGKLLDGFQNIARLRDLREIDLRLVLFLMRGAGGGLLPIAAGFGQSTTHLLGLVVFERAGVRLLLGDPEFGQDVKHLLALDLEFSG
jgi:hypothetical protein